MVHESLWEQLGEQEPEEVCRRTGAVFDAASGRYAVCVLGEMVEVDPAARTAVVVGECGEPCGEPDRTAGMAAVGYLLCPAEIVQSGEWASPLELPTGTIFFQGPHGLPTDRIEEAFGDSVEAFRAAGTAMGGTLLEFADASYRFDVLPRLPVAVLLWAADDEFPARARFLVDRAAGATVALDMLLVVIGLVTGRLVGQGTGDR